MQAETLFGISLDKELKTLPKCWFVNIQMVAVRGIPDRIGCINGKFFALEMKKDSKAKRAKLQEYVINKIKAAGGFAEFIYPENRTEVMEALNDFSTTRN